MYKGYLCLLLHAHLPYVRHPEDEHVLEENWLYEAITETYIPLIHIFESLIKDGVDFRITMSMTPPLVSMLKDPLLQERYIKHIDKLIGLAEKEMDRTGYQPHFHGLALMYHKRFTDARETFVKRYNKDIVSAFKRFQDLGFVEIIGSAATHGFLPIIGINESDARAQIMIGVEHYKKVFGRPPRGFWLPECGYYPGVDKILKEAGVKYFILDSHGVVNADPVPKYSVYAPIYCPSGVAAFGRDWESSKQVWSSKEGYPGDGDYREYYRDIGHELEYDYIKPYIHPSGLRINTGIKYWRITGNTNNKEPYVPDWAREKAAIHAANFMFNRQKQVEHLSAHMDRPPVILAPYDAELFGHWWFEGPMWIEFLMRKMAYDQQTVKAITPSEYLAKFPTNQVSLPSICSWGWKGYSEFWLEGSNDWLYKHLHVAGKRMAELASKFSENITRPMKDSLIFRAINQAARELVLAESSDWAFIMKTGTMVPYAQRRSKLHINRFSRLYNDISSSNIDDGWLSAIEARDNIFPDMNLAVFYLPKVEAVNVKTAARKAAPKRMKREFAHAG
jgi:1,4-alpha-glucan branching enzyme